MRRRLAAVGIAVVGFAVGMAAGAAGLTVPEYAVWIVVGLAVLALLILDEE